MSKDDEVSSVHTVKWTTNLHLRSSPISIGTVRPSHILLLDLILQYIWDCSPLLLLSDHLKLNSWIVFFFFLFACLADWLGPVGPDDFICLVWTYA